MIKARDLPVLLTIMITALPLFTCSNGPKVQKEQKDEGQDPSFPQGSWELISWKKGEDPPREPDEKSILRIEKDSSYSLELKVNECRGSMQSSQPGRLIFDTPSCTEMCCDTEFQKQMVKDLSAVRTFTLEKDRMILKGDGVRSEWRAAKELQR